MLRRENSFQIGGIGETRGRMIMGTVESTGTSRIGTKGGKLNVTWNAHRLLVGMQVMIILGRRTLIEVVVNM
jgi:hypothetical protein